MAQTVGMGRGYEEAGEEHSEDVLNRFRCFRDGVVEFGDSSLRGWSSARRWLIVENPWSGFLNVMAEGGFPRVLGISAMCTPARRSRLIPGSPSS